MSIAKETIFAKIEKELKLAKVAETQNEQNNHLHAMEVLLDLMLQPENMKESQKIGDSAVQAQEKPLLVNQGQKLIMEDGANGDSLFEF
ncbi:YwdI family protein [Listeria sp. PSOL-1]|uniref:YwdI family protein n=1 Tax=Listeria sp. PSOL-1 TaxID=1844999 RepID=UPI0013D34F06|nr:YwdI family protein [Listeria sp. PSOL-1]